MLFARYDFECTLMDNAILPPYKGSTFRGAFGGALKRVVCAVREQDCCTCLLAERCLYARTFEVRETEGGEKQRIAAPPHPYVIEPFLSSATRYRAGESFDFSLVLFGATNDYLPYFIYAFEMMGEGGIGKKITGGRTKFRLDRALHEGEAIYDGETRKLRTPALLKKLSVANPLQPVESGTLEVRFVTPLRLKSGNSLTAELPFHILIRAALRRISSLFACYGDGEPPLDYRGLVALAGEVETVQFGLHWYDWERWSNRQEQTMLMGGIMGNITYRGNFGPFVPLLDLCSDLHLGKQTAFGLGKIEYTFHKGES
jgi:hypothetical protein